MACLGTGEKKNKFLVVEVVSGGDRGLPAVTPWKNAEKASLWGNGITIEYLVGLSFCSNLGTLIIDAARISALSIEICKSITTLKVLDLSCGNNLGPTKLPAEIGSFIDLDYLNTTQSCVIELPVNVQQLKKLRFLFISGATFIPPGVISNLGLLQTFEQTLVKGSGTSEKYVSKLKAMTRYIFGELEGLEHIMDLSLVIRESECFQKLLDSPKLRRCTRKLTLCVKYSSAAVLDFCLMDHLEELRLQACHKSVIQLGSSFSFPANLQKVTIRSCYGVTNVSSLVYITNLCSLSVTFCSSMEELIDENDDTLLSLFLSLTDLTLKGLPKLKSICPQTALPFPSLKLLRVSDCPSLKKLPLDLNTAMTTPPELKIRGEREWWDNILQWDTQQTKDAFTPKFIPI